ncbi:hypothetical protein Q5P01_000992 [Channa striata]|uniref:Uncharacterized protein n=1 Tax=Channa striata TaxID=64152 RepID=A0AA88IK97_CHASR|nr:hypothetical protein Q5P01_000992 [Channa striata]
MSELFLRMKPPRPERPGSRPGTAESPALSPDQPLATPLRSGRARAWLLDGRGGHALGKRSRRPRYVARADRVLAALADIAEDRVGRPSLSSALMELEATLSRQTSVRDALALLLAPSSTEAAADIICSSYVRRKWGLATDAGWAS